MLLKKFKLNKWILLLLIALVIFPLAIDSSYALSLAIEIAIFAILAISYDLLIGYTGIVSFGHAIYFGLGAYTIAFLTVKFDWMFFPALLVALALSVVISLVIGAITIRVKDTYFSMVTLALGQLFFVLVLKLSKYTGGDDGFPGIAYIFNSKIVFFYFLIVLLILVYLFARRLVQSPTGRVLQAIRENEQRAGMIGYNLLQYKLLVLSISGTLATLAGALFVSLIGIAYPHLLHSAITLQAVFMTVLGGMGTLSGPILGAVIVRLADPILSSITSSWTMILGIIFVLLILFMPGGLTRIRIIGRKRKEPVKIAK